MYDQDQQHQPDPGASTTTFSWVESTNPEHFENLNLEEAVDYSIADDVSMSGKSEDATNNSNHLRVYVRLDNGVQLLIPIPRTASVDDLHNEVLRRASALGAVDTVANSVLKTTGNHASILFGEDLLTDVLDTTENATFLMTSLNRNLTSGQGPDSDSPRIPSVLSSTSINPPTRVSGSPWSTNNSWKQPAKTYIRWVTSRSALDTVYLRDIKVQSYPREIFVSVSELKQVALEQFDSKYTNALGVRFEAKDLELFLGDCYLADAPGKTFPIDCLAPVGTCLQNPITIFISTYRKLDDQSRLHDSWGVACSDRSASTFVTCLEILFSEVQKNNVKFNNLLWILWTITHFPPALLALKELHQQSIPKDLKSQQAGVRAMSILAESFLELANKMTPPWISKTHSTSLESSRQIFAWWHTLSMACEKLDGGPLPLVHDVKLLDVTGQAHPENNVAMFKNKELVEITDSDGQIRKRFLVSLMSLSHTPPMVLAHALAPGETNCNFYFHLPDNAQDLLEHKRYPWLHPADFDNLLETTNQAGVFRMVGPLHLANTQSSKLPIITLDSAGFVSIYGQNVALCGDGSYFTKNTIRGEENMSDTNPGQYLLHKLAPIMMERKADHTWEVDAWSEVGISNNMSSPEEAIVICVDISGSMEAEMGAGWVEGQSDIGANLVQNQFSRLTEVKDVFKNMVSRISAYNLPTHLGLVTFSRRVDVLQPLTPVLLNFQNRLDKVHAGGQTAIFDAIRKAKAMLIDLKARHPDLKTRIVVLTDGEDNSSFTFAPSLCRELYFTDIVLDAIVIGTDATSDLFKFAKHTGGYAFCPKTRSALFQIFLLETFIDLKTRPSINKPILYDYATSMPKSADMQTTYDFPPCRPHPNQNDHFISLRDAHRFLSTLSRAGTGNPTAGYAASEATARSGSTKRTGTTAVTVGSSSVSRLILNEIKLMIENHHGYIDIYISESSMGFWEIVMQGPPDSPYEDGTFLLYIELGDQFPRQPPTARFITPILHPNITKHGRICHPIFDREWTPDMHIFQVIQQLWGILMSLEARDAIDPLFTLKFWTDPESGRREVKQYVQRFALASRDVHRANILNVNSVTDSGSSSPTSRSTIYTPLGTDLASRLTTLRTPSGSSSSGTGSTILTPTSSATILGKF